MRQTLLIALIVSLLGVLALATLPFVRIAENWATDLRVASIASSREAAGEIALVLVDEETLASLAYRAPVDRDFMRALLQDLEAKGVRAIGLDILFDQATEVEKDRALRDTLSRLSVPVVVASGAQSDGLTVAQVEYLNNYVRGLSSGVAAVSRDQVDAIVRFAVISREGQWNEQPGFAAALAGSIGERTTDRARLRLDYHGGAAAFPVYAAHDVALLPAEWFKGRIVLVGAAAGLGDSHRTPFSALGIPSLPGVAIHAHALSQILGKRDEPLVLARLSLVSVYILALLGCGIASLNLRLPLGGSLALAAIVGLWMGGFWIYREFSLLIPLVVPTGVFVTSAGWLWALRWRRERNRSRFIRDAFATYLSPAVVAQLVADPSRLELGGERRDATLLFTDVAGYTTFSEKLPAEQLVDVMNEYLDGAIDIAFEHGGTIDKIVGDALHVMFNAPLDQPDHPQRAVRCALEIDAYCRAFLAEKTEQGVPFGGTRIGVNTGEVIVGNIGGKHRFDYSATGDPINIAARLESANKALGTWVCVSGGTAHRCEGIRFRPVGWLRLAGKNENVEVFEPVREDAPEDLVEPYLEAYGLMEMEAPAAGASFKALAEQHPDDPLAGLHARRLAAGQTGSVIVMESK